MALTPEDVVNKRFQPTKFREGYDQDEVDDFLDEVVVELRRLNQENEELRQRLIASDSRIAELQRSGGQGAQASALQAQAAPPEAAAPAPAGPPVSALLGTAPVGVEPPQTPQPETPTPAVGYQAPVSDANAIDPTNTNNLLQLARRLHEEHVREGVEKRDALIAEGHATAARLVAEAEQQQRAQLGTLDQERSVLEHRIDELRTFEREYRQKLKSYIEGQLHELDSSSEVLAGAPAASAPVAAPSVPTQNFGSPAAPPPANYPGFASN